MHIEKLDDLSTDVFINGFVRFVGGCSTGVSKGGLLILVLECNEFVPRIDVQLDTRSEIYSGVIGIDVIICS